MDVEAHIAVKQAQHSVFVRAARQGLFEVTTEIAAWVGEQAVREGLLTVSADRLAPAGTPATVTLSTFKPSPSPRLTPTSSGIAVSSPRDVSPVVRFGASATTATVTATGASPLVAMLKTPVSVSDAVELTCSVKSAPEPAGGVIVSPSSCATVSV